MTTDVCQYSVDLQTKKWPQYMAAFCASLPMLCAGCVLGWTSPAIDHLMDSENQTNITNFEVSLVATITGLGAVMGTIPANFFANRIGRKNTLLMTTSCYLLGWLLIILADNNVSLLCIARLISGLGIGSGMVIIPLYNEEISDIDVRGTLGYYVDFMIVVGLMWTFVFGLFLSYFWLTIVCAVPAILFYFTFIWMPESPLFLVSKSREIRAVKALKFLKGIPLIHNYNTDFEMYEIKQHLKEDVYDSAEENHNLVSRDFLKQCFFSSEGSSNTAKAARIMVGLVILVQATGVEGITYYSIEIFQRSKTSISPYLCNALFGIIQFVSSIVYAFLVDKIGRRKCLFISGSGMAFSTALLMLHFALLGINVYADNFGFLPCVSVSILMSSYAAGLAPIPWLLLAEIIPTDSKVLIASICVSISWLAQFLFSQFFSFMFYNLNDVITFGICCFMCILNILYVAFFIPETKNKTRSEIQRVLGGR